MKICFVAVNLSPATGLGRMVTSIANGLSKDGFETGYIHQDGQTDRDSERVIFGGSLRRPFRFIKNLRKARKFARQYDVVVCFDVKPAALFVHIACFGIGKKIVVHVLGTYSMFEPKNAIKNTLIKYVYNHSAKLFLINEFVKRKIEDSAANFSFSKDVAYVPVGVDVQLFSRDVTSVVDVPKPYIISVGAIKHRKSQLLSLQAFHEVSKKHPNLKYVIVGSQTDKPAYFQKVKDYIDLHSLHDSVILMTDVTDDELIALYKNAQFFILTPISTGREIEGFGMVYIESALAGITAIGTYDSGAEAAIVNEETGLLAQYDVEDVASKMEKLLNDDDLRLKLAKSAFVHAKGCDWQEVVDLYTKELNSL